jgi:hypothetical protein
MKSDQEEMISKIGVLVPWMDFVQAKAAIYEDETTAAIRSCQEKTEAAMNCSQAELEETVKHRVNDALTSIDQQSQGLCEDLDARIKRSP